MWMFPWTSAGRETSEFLPVPVFSGRWRGECIPASQRCRKVRTPLWTRWSHCWSPQDTQSTGTGTAGKPAEGAAAAQERQRKVQMLLVPPPLSQLRKLTLVTTGDVTQWARARIQWSDAVCLFNIIYWDEPHGRVVKAWCNSWQQLGNWPDRPHHNQVFDIGNSCFHTSEIFRLLHTSRAKPLDKHEHKSFCLVLEKSTNHVNECWAEFNASSPWSRRPLWRRNRQWNPPRSSLGRAAEESGEKRKVESHSSSNFTPTHSQSWRHHNPIHNTLTLISGVLPKKNPNR